MPAIDDDDRPKKKIVHEIGQDLTLLSVGELTERIALLKEEIARLEANMASKQRVEVGGRSVLQEVSGRRCIAARQSDAKRLSAPINPILSFPLHYSCLSIFMDIEWLLSTLFDASLLSLSSRRQRRLFFLSRFGAHFPTVTIL